MGYKASQMLVVKGFSNKHEIAMVFLLRISGNAL